MSPCLIEGGEVTETSSANFNALQCAGYIDAVDWDSSDEFALTQFYHSRFGFGACILSDGDGNDDGSGADVDPNWCDGCGEYHV